MSESQSNNTRIAKNTILLYFRMLLLMAVSLYTSRVVLNALGVVDFGLYSVVGGVVAMFSIISGSLTASISRFITFELGAGNKEKLHDVFCTSVSIQIALSIIIVVLAETVGLWFLNYKMVIPEDRMFAANWVYQFSIINFILSLMMVPYNASIVAHEKMSAFAYISIFDAVAKLFVAYVICVTPIDRLITYARLLVFISIITRTIYYLYCHTHFEECHYQWKYDHNLFVNMFGFAGWNFIGSTAAILRDQGGNVIINLFCGPAVNAARGISTQVSASITGFVSNFQTALNPQITKNYASGNREYMLKLVTQGSRLSYYILLILSLPVIINAEYILQLWLGQVPEHTVYFIQLVLFFALCESIGGPLITSMLATGSIRNYQIVVGGLNLLNLPLAYCCLKSGLPPESVLVVAIVVSFICMAARLVMLRSMIGLSIRSFVNKVYVNVSIVTISSFFPIFIANQHIDINVWSFLAVSSLSVLWSFVTIYVIGCNKDERLIVISALKKIIRKFKNND